MTDRDPDATIGARAGPTDIDALGRVRGTLTDRVHGSAPGGSGGTEGPRTDTGGRAP